MLNSRFLLVFCPIGSEGSRIIHVKIHFKLNRYILDRNQIHVICETIRRKRNSSGLISVLFLALFSTRRKNNPIYIDVSPFSGILY